MSFSPVFFDTLFPTADGAGTDVGYVAISEYSKGVYKRDEQPTQHTFYAWPSQREQLFARCLSNEKLDVFTYACLFTAPTSVDLQFVGRRYAVAADIDTMSPTRLLAEPTVVVAVAEDTRQVYWVTDTSDRGQAERTSQAIGYEHATHGARTDVWNSLSPLRVPGTWNSERACTVEVSNFGMPMTSVSLKSAYPDLSEEEAGIPLEPMPEYWHCTTASTMESRAVRKVSRPVESMCVDRKTQRTQANLDHFLRLLSQHGVSQPTALHMAWEALCNPHRDPEGSWGGDGAGEMATWKDVLRAYADPENVTIPRMRERVTSMLSVTGGSPEIPRPEFITDEESILIAGDCFIDKYERWAATQTDAPVVYHRLNAVIILSSVFGEFGACPNGDRLTKWGMTLGPTTWARKTTAMNLMKKVLASLHDRKFDYLIASNFTPEALSVALANRGGRSSLVARDEADGLFEEILGKQFMSGTAESLTDMFNGFVPKRIRVGDGSAEETGESGTEEVTTNFVLYTCATTDKMTKILTEDLIKSGFLTRFIYAVADPGEPVEGSLYLDLTGDDDDDDYGDPMYEKLVQELAHARAYWHHEKDLEQGAFKKIRFTPEANKRWNVFQDYLVRYCPDPSMKDLVRPVAARMAFSVMRLAVTLTMAERQDKVQLESVLRAIQYAEEWFQSAYTVIHRITGNPGYDAQEKILAVIKELVARGGRVTESEVWRRFRLKMDPNDYRKHMKALELASIIELTVSAGKSNTTYVKYLGK